MKRFRFILKDNSEFDCELPFELFVLGNHIKHKQFIVINDFSLINISELKKITLHDNMCFLPSKIEFI